MPATFAATSKQYLSLDNVTTGAGTGAVTTPTQGLILDFTSGSVLTVAAYVKLTDTSNDYCILAKNQDSYANGAYLLRYNNGIPSPAQPLTAISGPTLEWVVNTYSGSFVASVPAPNNMTTAGSGVFVVCQWNNGSCSISVNNGTAVVASTKANIMPEAKQFTGTAHDTVATDTHMFTIGYDPTNPNATYMNGQIGSVGVWNRELTATERTALFNSGKPVLFAALGTASDCAGYWDLDADANDDSQWGQNLTNHATVTFSASWT